MGKLSRVMASAIAIPGSMQSYMFDRLFGVSISVESVAANYRENNGYGGSH